MNFVVLLLCLLGITIASPLPQTSCILPEGKIQPKVFIVTMFSYEEGAWTSRLDFTHNITIPGASPLYTDVHCVEDFSICQFIAGEGEINAASSITALLLNPQFDLKKTYFLLNGIAGGEPDRVTLGSVTFAAYAIQVGLEYQVDSRELPEAEKDWPSGYYSYGTTDPWTYPANVYGTEVFELNKNLRDRALSLAENNVTSFSVGTDRNIYVRTLYEGPANSTPSAVACDVNTSDNYYFGNVLSDYFKNYTLMISNNTANYCSTAQEDNASLEAILRMDKAGLVSYDRVIVMRTISDFARPPPSITDEIYFFNEFDQGGSLVAVDNLYHGGYPIVEDILENWDEIYDEGIAPDNYIGDILGTLGGTPDFGSPDLETS